MDLTQAISAAEAAGTIYENAAALTATDTTKLAALQTTLATDQGTEGAAAQAYVATLLALDVLINQEVTAVQAVIATLPQPTAVPTAPAA